MKRLWLLLVGLLVILVPIPVSAADISYDISSSYVLGEETVDVSHEVILSGGALGDQVVRVPGRSDSFTVTAGVDFVKKDSTASANGIPFAATDITLKLGSKTSQKVVIAYQTTDLHAEYEQADSVFVPPLDLEGSISKQSITLTAPLDLELGNIVGAEISDATTVGGEQTYSFERDSAFTSPIILQLGSTTNADIIIKSSLKNEGWWWKTKSVVLPLDTNQQRSYLKSIEPKPNSVRVDTDGNIIADYSLRPKQSVEVTTEASIVLEQKLYDLENESSIEQIDKDLVADYTKPTDLWPKDVLKSLNLDADKLRAKSVIEAIKDVHGAVLKESPAYSDKTDFAKRNGNKSIKEWSSVEYSDRTIAALRALGIPARMVGGVVTDNQLTTFDTPERATWVEAYVPDIGWITVDPVMGELSDSFFGQAGLQKVAFFIWGVSDHIPEFQNDSVSVKYSKNPLPDDSFKGKLLTSQNLILLPGVSVLRSVVKMPAGVIHDDVSVRAQKGEMRLGSLAPLQERQTFRFVVGEDSWQNVSTNLIVGGDSVAKATAHVSYLLAVVEVILLGIVLWFMLKWRKKKRAPIVLHDDDSKDYVIEGQDLLNARSDTQPERSADPLRDDAPPGP